MKKRALSFLLILAMIVTLFTGLSICANAEDAIPIDSDFTITQNGTYQLSAEMTGEITVSEGVTAVTIIGNGAEWENDLTAENFGAVTSTANSSVKIDCTAAAGITLTLKDLYISNSFIGDNTIDFSGTGNTLVFAGTVILDHDNNTQGYAGIHVPKGGALNIYGTTGSTFYMYKREQAAGIGANNNESCGTITFGKEGGANDFYFYMKGAKQGAVIGNGANCSETPGDITFYSGIYNLIANARGALIGGSAGASSFDAGNVYIKGGLLNLNIDYSGAAIGGGGYEAGNDKIGGNVYISGGSIRTYIDTNAVNLWSSYGVTEAGVNDVAITAKKLDAAGNPVTLTAIDTTDIEADENGNYTVVVDGKTYYSGPLYRYCFCYENVDRDLSADVYPNGTPGNWIPLNSEKNLYIYLTEGSHSVTVNDVLVMGHSYNEDGFCNCVNGEYNPDAESYTVRTAKNLAAIAAAVNDGDTLSGKTVILANDISLADIEAWTPIGGASTEVELTLTSQEDLAAALEDHFIIYDNVGNSYVRNSDKNGNYDPNRTYYYLKGAAFDGTFDGQNYTISDMTVQMTTGYAGLFGNVTGTVKNVTVSGAVISTTTQDFIGGIAGKLSAGGLIENCVNKVNVTADSAYNIGGVVGIVGEPGQFVSDSIPMATVRNCVNEGNVRGNARVGGIVGRNAGTITGCVNHGDIFNVSGSKRGTGGIVGMNGINNFPVADAGIVEFCYNDGHVDANNGYWTGGIVGFQNNRSTCTSCYNAGTLDAADTSNPSIVLSYVNPIIGCNEGQAFNCVWLNQDTGDNTANYIGKDTTGTGIGSQGGTETNCVGMTEADLKTPAAVAHLNGEAEQGFQSSCSAFPVLYWQQAVAHTIEVDAAVAPTCTEAGLTEGSHCNTCGAVLTEQAVDPALGHDYTQTVVAPTCTSGGYTQYTCATCGDSYTGDQTSAISCPSSSFTDVPAANNWAHAGIDFVVAHNLFNGVSTTNFAPDESMKRDMLVTVLYRMEGSPKVEYSEIFTDVPDGVWSTDGIIWAAENEIVNGVGDGRYCPRDELSREQIAAILYRYADDKGYDVSAHADLSVYPDSSNVSDWAKDYVSWANAEGFIQGASSSGTIYLDAKGDATRAQVAAILMRFMQRYN